MPALVRRVSIPLAAAHSPRVATDADSDTDLPSAAHRRLEQLRTARASSAGSLPLVPPGIPLRLGASLVASLRPLRRRSTSQACRPSKSLLVFELPQIRSEGVGEAWVSHSLDRGEDRH